MTEKENDVIVAKTAGFCPGVKKAIDTVLALAQSGRKKIYTLGPLIHNPQVIQTLEEKGIHAVKSLAEITDKNSVLVIRAHGITPELEKTLRESGLEIVDATCPLVKHAHRIIDQYAAQGYSTVIVGDSGHAEVIGLMGYARGKGHVIANAEEAKSLPHFDKVNIVSQTTQEEDIFSEAAAIVKQNSGEAVISNTICQPTKDRQRETVELARNADMMIIVGGKHSANTARLAKLCAALCKNTVHIEQEEELLSKDLSSPRRIAITAGASTPSWMTDRVSRWIAQTRAAAYKTPLGRLERMWHLVINSYLYAALAATALNYVCMRLQGDAIRPLLLGITFLFVFSLSIINRAADKDSGTSERHKMLLFRRHKSAMITLGLIAGAASVILAAGLSLTIAAIIVLCLLAGIIYPLRNELGTVKIAELPGSKDIVTALGWGFVCACIPALYQHSVFTKANYLALILAVLLVFMRSVMLGISAVHTDLIVGRENFYKALGPSATKAFLVCISGGIVIVLLLLHAMGWKTKLAGALLAGTVYIIACVAAYAMEKYPRGLWADTLVDGQFFVLAALALLA